MKSKTILTGTVKIAVFIIMMSFSGSAAVASTGTDTIQIEKNTLFRAAKISLYTDVKQKVVFFSVRGEEGKVYLLYLFDIEGRMVKQTETRNKQTSVIKGIDKGVYLFEVFSDDTRIGNGRIAVK